MSTPPINILLAEDRLDDATLTKEVLLESGINFNLTVVSNGSEAISYLKSASLGEIVNPDIVLLDLNMPETDGHTVLQKMRGTLGLDSIPVVVLTVSDSEQDVTNALNVGMNFYLKKPAKTDTIGPLVKTICSLWSNQKTHDGKEKCANQRNS